MLRHGFASLALSFAVASTGCAAAPTASTASPAAPEPRNGIAEVYASGPFDRSYAGSVVVALPDRPRNASWFTNWIMLVARESTSPEQPFVQVGVMRWIDAHAYPSAFITYTERGGSLVYVDLGRIAEGEHRAAIVGNREKMSLYLDGRLLRSFSRARFFRTGDAVYFQFAGEVKAPGDEPSGYIRDLEIKRDAWPSLRTIYPVCTSYDRGLDMRRVGDRYVLSGRFDASKPSGFRNCDNFW